MRTAHALYSGSFEIGSRASLVSSFAATPAANISPAAPDPRKFLDSYCVTCHNQRLHTAGLALDTVDLAHPSAHAEVLDSIGGASEADLFDPDRFAWRQGSPFINAVAGNTYGHYEEHIGLIRGWLDNGKRG